MIEVHSEGIVFLYFASPKHWTLEAFIGLGTPPSSIHTQFFDDFIIEKTSTSDHIRLAAFKYPLPYWSQQILYWIIPPLAGLDERVINGTYSDKDFDDSVPTYYKYVMCTTCNWKGRGLLLHDGQNFYLPNRYLMEKKYDLAFENRVKLCPICGSPFRITVMKILED
jgi:hypothetical protein